MPEVGTGRSQSRQTDVLGQERPRDVLVILGGSLTDPGFRMRVWPVVDLFGRPLLPTLFAEGVQLGRTALIKGLDPPEVGQDQGLEFMDLEVRDEARIADGLQQ